LSPRSIVNRRLYTCHNRHNCYGVGQ
jgi:hypothetical protein